MRTPADKARRQLLVLEILEQKTISSQEELASALERRGVSVTQATLSRDLRALKVTRAPTEDGYRYVPAASGNGGGRAHLPEERLKQLAALEVVGIDSNEVVVAIRTIPGRAQGVASYLDGLGLNELLATVAGDDTVMVHPKKTSQTKKLRRLLTDMLEGR